ncbi:hypothetical protein GCM10023335_85120 [Streptomyces siamensis]|uniref:Uncharacterized protein n=1 Tax=Streptomyces siamensis TaxID=1274986 RepID=A0ABP9JQB6_9ACTN
MPAEARSTTDRVVAIRMAQRGFLRRTGGRPEDRTSGLRARGGCGWRCGRAGERRGVGKGDTSGRPWAWGSVSTVGRYDLRPAP